MTTNSDDWREETQVRLEKSLIYHELKKKCESDPSGSHVMSTVDDATHYAYHRTKMILRHMGEYTIHDGDHLFRVLKLMGSLITKETLEDLSVPELMLLTLSAFFHDIGMAPSEKDVLAWKTSWDGNKTFNDADDENQHALFSRFLATQPDLQQKLYDFQSQGKESHAAQIQNHLISLYIRSTHADRARDIIEQDWSGKIKYRDTDLTSEFAAICFNHNEDPLSSLEFDLKYLCGPSVSACLRLVAVLLRVADILDFDAKRTPEVLFSHLHVRNPVSISEWNKHRSIDAWEISARDITFHAKCKHPAIEAAIHSFCDYIDKELSGSNNVISTINEYSKTNNRAINIQIPFRIDRSKIQTAKDLHGKPLYTYRETQFNLSKSKVIDLLMGTKLYGDPEVALRELIQNSIDACLLRSALEKSWGNPYTPEIQIKYFSEDGDDILEVTDNGTGMDQYIIDSYYSNIGSSFYKSGDFYKLKAEANASFNPTSRFGIGILSCFLVSDSITVDTRRVKGPHDSSEPLNVIIEGQESIFWIKPGSLSKPGTSTRLHLRKASNPWEKMSEAQFTKSVENVIPNPPFSISIETAHDKTTRDENSFRTIKASSLKNGGWEKHPNIRTISMDFDDVEDGFVGTAIVAILQKKSTPVSDIEMKSSSVLINHSSYNLSKSMQLSGKDIDVSTTSITIDEDGDIQESNTTSTLNKSASRISLHGIEIPMSLFPDYWRRQKNQITLNWPLPILLVVDVCGKSDLDLNSSRTQILQSSKWDEFEKRLAKKVLLEIRKKVSPTYWETLVDLLLPRTKNDIFKTVLKGLRLSNVPKKRSPTRDR